MYTDEPSAAARDLARKVLSNTLSKDRSTNGNDHVAVHPSPTNGTPAPIVHTHIHIPPAPLHQAAAAFSTTSMPNSTATEIIHVGDGRTSILDDAIARTSAEIDDIDQELKVQSQALRSEYPSRVSVQTTLTSALSRRPRTAPAQTTGRYTSPISMSRGLNTIRVGIPDRSYELAYNDRSLSTTGGSSTLAASAHAPLRQLHSTGNLLDRILSPQVSAAPDLWNRNISPYRTLGNASRNGNTSRSLSLGASVSNNDLFRRATRRHQYEAPEPTFDPTCVACAAQYAPSCASCRRNTDGTVRTSSVYAFLIFQLCVEVKVVIHPVRVFVPYTDV